MSIEKLENSHAHLFSIPDSKKALLTSFLCLFVFSLIIAFLWQRNNFLSVFAFHFAIFALLTYTFPLCIFFQLNEGATALNFKRSLWTSTFSSIMGIFSYLVAMFISTPPLSLFFIFLAFGIKVFWDILVVYTFSFISFLKAVFLGLSGFSFSFISYTFLSGFFKAFPAYFLIPLLITVLIFIGAVLLLVAFVNFLTQISVNVSGIDLFRGFVLIWLSGKRKFLEMILEKVSVEKELPIYLTVFCSPNYKGIWVIPTIHPGPLLTVGSSDMTNRIGSQIKTCLGAPVMFFHGTCSHSENLISLSEQKKLMKLIINNIEQGKQAEKVSPPFSISHKDITVFSQLFGNRAIFSISRSPKPMDDISFNVGKFLSESIKEEDFNCAIIDSHNSIDLKRKKARKVDLNDPLVDTFLEGIKKAKKTLQRLPEDRKEKTVKFGIGNASTKLSVNQGMGPEGIKVATLGIQEKKYCYILFDSNNLESGLREYILENVKKKFEIEAGEVFTSDTHVVNARGSRGGYPLLGYREKEVLFGEVSKALKEALSNMEPCKVFNLKVSNTFQVQGTRSASLLKNFGENSLKIFQFALFISLLPAFLGITILSLLL